MSIDDRGALSAPAVGPSRDVTGRELFGQYAAHYDAALAKGLSVSGEDKDYFARGRMVWLARCMRELGERVDTVMDFGCGTGSATSYVLDLIDPKQTLGIDVSPESVELARRDHGSERTRFALFDEYRPNAEIDLVFCNGVFHHIPLSERATALSYVYRSLRPGGLFALWENNPWNPGTRLVMSRIPFDRDAITLSAPAARRMLSSSGFSVVRTDFLFIFPRMLRGLRGLEPLMSRLPVGAQYQVLCRKR